MAKLPLFVHAPVVPSLEAGLAVLSQGDQFRVHVLKFDAAVFPLFFEARPCVVLASMNDLASNAFLYQLMKELKEYRVSQGAKARDPGFRIVIVSEGTVPRANWSQLGIHELMVGPVSSNVLAFKLSRHFQKAESAGLEDLFEIEPESVSELKATESETTPEWRLFKREPFEPFESQTRVIRTYSEQLEKASVNVRIPGLEKAEGEWKRKEDLDSGEEKWEWVERPREPKATRVKWNFIGSEEPVFNSEDGTWKFHGAAPTLLKKNPGPEKEEVFFEYRPSNKEGSPPELRARPEAEIKSVQTEVYVPKELKNASQNANSEEKLSVEARKREGSQAEEAKKRKTSTREAVAGPADSSVDEKLTASDPASFPKEYTFQPPVQTTPTQSAEVAEMDKAIDDLLLAPSPQKSGPPRPELTEARPKKKKRVKSAAEIERTRSILEDAKKRFDAFSEEEPDGPPEDEGEEEELGRTIKKKISEIEDTPTRAGPKTSKETIRAAQQFAPARPLPYGEDSTQSRHPKREDLDSLRIERKKLEGSTPEERKKREREKTYPQQTADYSGEPNTPEAKTRSQNLRTDELSSKTLHFNPQDPHGPRKRQRLGRPDKITDLETRIKDQAAEQSLSALYDDDPSKSKTGRRKKKTATVPASEGINAHEWRFTKVKKVPHSKVLSSGERFAPPKNLTDEEKASFMSRLIRYVRSVFDV